MNSRSAITLDYRSAYLLSEQKFPYIISLFDVENNYRKVIVHAQGNSGRIHDLKVLLYHIEVRYYIIFFGRRILGGIGRINTVDLGPFQDDLRPDFHGPERRSSICCEVWVSRPGSKDNDPPFFKMTHCFASYVRFGQFTHLYRRLYSSLKSEFLKRILQGESVDDCSEHP